MDEEILNKQIDADLTILEENLSILIQNAMVTTQITDSFGGEKLEPKENLKIQQEHFMMEGATENIIRSAQSLLSMTANLRMSLITNDFEGLIQTLNQRKLVVQSQDLKNDVLLSELQKDLSEMSKELEVAYYS